ncbi:MAG: sugar phosphate isomerase/epimerase [Chloroflexota bacterium]|nr:sugar phosphate isomerase/epimerase [Chloroflexota bacterium]
MKLGVDVFSLRFNDWSADELLDYSHSIGVDVVHFSEVHFFESLDRSYLEQVKRHADELGIAIEVGMGSICPTSTTFSPARGTASEQLAEMLHVAALMGSPAMRCYMGSNADRRTELPFAAHQAATVETLHSVRSLAVDLGVKIAIENHAGDMQGRELAALIEQAGPDFVGACVDTGNPLWVAESPFVTLEHIAPHVLMCHVRDTALWRHPLGAVAQWVAIGEGTIGIDKWTQILRGCCPDINYTLEVITSLAPRVLNFLEPEFWVAYPDTPAEEFARFLQLVEAGRPYTEPILTADAATMPPEYRTALAWQQRAKLEQSVRYCRNVLQIA